jgi:hypothetical protein
LLNEKDQKFAQYVTSTLQRANYAANIEVQRKHEETMNRIAELEAGITAAMQDAMARLRHECIEAATRCDQGPGQEAFRELENSLNAFLQKSFAERDSFQQTRLRLWLWLWFWLWLFLWLWMWLWLWLWLWLSLWL